MGIRRYEASDFDGVDELWTEAFSDDPPRNHATNAIPAKLAIPAEMLLVAEKTSVGRE